MNFISLGEKNQECLKEPSKKKKKLRNNKLSKSKSTKYELRKKKWERPRGGIIYIGHIPHGFYEDEMKSYFNQFGTVTTTCVSRSRKTGRSRGYGFVEFKDEEVAKIAAETMNNYLMYNKVIKCRYIPPEERMKAVYNADISTHNYPRQKNRKVDLKNKSKALLKMNQASYLEKIEKKIKQFKEFFEKNGVDFTFTVNDSKDNSTKNESEKSKMKTSSNELEAENEADNVNGVLEIDESDGDISFKTPPKVKKVIKKSKNAPAVPKKNSMILCSDSILQKISKSNTVSKKVQNQERKPVRKNKTKLAPLKQTQNGKKTGKKSKKNNKKELLEKTFNKEKSTSKKVSGATLKKIRKEKVKRDIADLKKSNK